MVSGYSSNQLEEVGMMYEEETMSFPDYKKMNPYFQPSDCHHKDNQGYSIAHRNMYVPGIIYYMSG